MPGRHTVALELTEEDLIHCDELRRDLAGVLASEAAPDQYENVPREDADCETPVRVVANEQRVRNC
jgi:hypothetical protein